MNAWVNSRREVPHIGHYTEAPEHIDWPNLKPPPQENLGELPVSATYQLDQPDDQPDDHAMLSDVEYCEDIPSIAWATDRRDRREQGLEFLDWQRPPQGKVPPGCYVLATGAVIPEGMST